MDHDQVSWRCSRTGIKTKDIKDEKDAGLRFPKGIKIAYSTQASFRRSEAEEYVEPAFE